MRPTNRLELLWTGLLRQAWRTSLALLAGLMCLALTACGGGSGGPIAETGNLLKVTVSDTFGARVPAATVESALGSFATNEQGTALLLLDRSVSTATVKVTRPTFVEKSLSTPITGEVTELNVTLERATSAAGGSMPSRGDDDPEVSAAGQQLTFEVELVVVDGASQPIANLGATNFTLRPCTPDLSGDRADCVRGASPSADVAYTPVTPTPESLQFVPGSAQTPYAAGLLIDQSASISTSDPTGARLYSAKSFVQSLGTGDHALLAAFAGNPGAKLPSVPLTLYGPARDQSTAPSYISTLDSLTSLIGGNTPLYASIDILRDHLVNDASLPPVARAMVVFTDGTDTTCGQPNACAVRRAATIQAAADRQVRVFAIGLSRSVDVVALGELAHKTGGALLFADTAEQLLPLYGSVGRLLGGALPTYRLRWTVQAPTADAFKSGDTLLGRVSVSGVAPGGLDISFVVVIP